MDEVVFEVDGQPCALTEPEARVLAERLRGFAAGQYGRDVAQLEELSTDPEWLDGSRALADAIEDVLTATRRGPIPLDPAGKAADAVLAALALSAPTSFDATSGLARLYRAMSQARAD